MSSHDAGAVIAYLPNSWPDHGSSDADGARLRTEASDLSDRLGALVEGGPSPYPMRCHVGLILRRLEGKDRETLVRLLDEPRADGSLVPATEIAGVLAGAGFTIQAPSIRRHRRRKSATSDRCTCE